MPTKLLACLGFLYKVVHKLALSLCSFSQFSFPFGFWTANALVLKFGTLPLSCLFLQSFVRDFSYIVLFKSYSPFCTEKWVKIDMRACFSTYLYFKSEFKKSRARFFSSQMLIAGETKSMSVASPVFNLKAIELGAFFAYFHLFRHL